ncbi:flavodoxin domain-containing protein [Georgenia sp. SYP-B2076]|uniref:flavodoxin domain-containing protein n=1 Tax=Georgenia sp. SYP-B2076 TaxID=2495881 RepID=UPI0013DF4A94|nr:flavodoxin domain-containing protein [Georgenia sp. SYP-B2076]
MGTRVLVAYASRHGSTAEIAEAVGAVLRTSGRDVDVLPVADVIDLRAYDAVILGSAIYHGQWMAEGRSFLRRMERQRPGGPTWLFSTGPTGEHPHDGAVAAALSAPEAARVPGDLAALAQRAGVRGYVMFAGKVGEEATGFLERWKTRGDWRDFDRVTAWAVAIDAQLRAA